MIYDKKSCSVINTRIHDDLGQIDYIFTDKTGTLTNNQMNFKNCLIVDKNYDE